MEYSELTIDEKINFKSGITDPKNEGKIWLLDALHALRITGASWAEVWKMFVYKMEGH